MNGGGHLGDRGWRRRTGVTIAVYRVAAGLLVALAVLTGLTGARTPVVWSKVCPVLLTTSAALLVLASAI
jgi:hypothetical protein